MGRLIDVDNIEYYLEEGGSAVAFKADIDQIPTADIDTDSAYAEGWTAAESKYRAMMSDGDCISRRAAIDAICKEGTRLERNGTVAMCEIKQWCVDLLERLPSAQPEIIRCKDCSKWHTVLCPFFSKYITVMPNKEQYCSLAERRTDEQIW